jgi:uncharacterized RDD family membrane protein YckC
MKCVRCSMKLSQQSLVCVRCGERVPRIVPIPMGTRPDQASPRAPVRLERPAPGIVRPAPAPPAPAARARHAATVWARNDRRLMQGHVPLPSTIGPVVVSANAVRKLEALPSELHHAKTDPAFHHAAEADTDADVTVDALEAPARPLPLVWARLGAGLVDAMVVGALTLCAVVAGVVAYGPSRLVPFASRGIDYVVDALFIGQQLGLFVAGLGLLVAFAYTTLCVFLLGTTLGKSLLGLAVVDVRGRAPTAGEAMARSLALGAGVAPAGFGYAFALFDRDHAPLHDRLVGTRVVRRAA